MKILITGARGQIGSDLVTELSSQGFEVIASDLQLPAPISVSPASASNIRWQTLDVCDRAQVFDALASHRPDAVFHLAAILSARGEAMPQATYDVNQTGTYHMLEASREYGVSLFFFPSTIAVYGPDLPDPTPEHVPLCPTTMYGVTKVSGELLCNYYRDRYQLDVRGLRFPGLISAVMPGGGSSDYALFMYLEGLRSGHYQAFCRPDTRIPFMYMPDALRSVVELCRAPRASLTRCIYNVTSISPSAAEIAASVSRAIPGAEITFAPEPGKQAILDSWPNALDDSRARADWGWRPKYDLDAMTADLVPRVRALLAKADAERAPEARRAAPRGQP